MPRLAIRSFTESDTPACAAVFDSNVPYAMLDEEREPFLRCIKSDEVRYFVAEDESGAIVACGGYGIADHRMCWGMVHRDHHRKGIGTALLAERVRRLRAECGDVAVELDTSQVGRPFFEAMGFEVLREQLDHYAPGVHRYDMLLKAGQPLS